jgi:hypothetical protein
MLTRNTGTRKLIANNMSNGTISNANSVNININSNMNTAAETIDFPSFIAKTLLPIEKMEIHLISNNDMNSLKNGVVTDEMIERIKLKPKIIHAGSFMNKLRKTNKYKLSKRIIFNVNLIDKESYEDHGSKSNLYGKIGEIYMNSKMMDGLTPTEVKFVNEIYNINQTIPLNVIGSNGSNSGSSMAGVIPAAGNLLSGIATGGRRRRSRKMRKGRKTAKKSSRGHRMRRTRKH